MSPEENKAMLRRMIHEVIVGGDLELMDQLVAPDFINHNVVGTGETSQALGVENFRQEILALRSALTDLAIDEVHVLADGDYVIAHVRGRGPHTGEFGGVPPTGK
ncbi:MAG TPA: ester cyclase [Actinomycetota bacterium]|nr:ester cyclase [Actinomycetota bacterium]